MWKSLLIVPVFGAATLSLYLIAYLAPEIEGVQKITLGLPGNFEELKLTVDLFRKYYGVNQQYVLCLFSYAYLYKQAFAIPGSAVMNILAGSLFGVTFGLPLCCLLTATGATMSFFLSSVFLKEIVHKYFAIPLDRMQKQVELNKNNLLYFLLSMRLFPVAPNWLINITSPIVGVPLQTFFITVLFGMIPYNLLCVQSGSMISTLSSLNDVFTWTSALQLVVLASMALGPTFIKQRVGI